jgi:hypothetical protein
LPGEHGKNLLLAFRSGNKSAHKRSQINHKQSPLYSKNVYVQAPNPTEYCALISATPAQYRRPSTCTAPAVCLHCANAVRHTCAGASVALVQHPRGAAGSRPEPGAGGRQGISKPEFPDIPCNSCNRRSGIYARGSRFGPWMRQSGQYGQASTLGNELSTLNVERFRFSHKEIEVRATRKKRSHPERFLGRLRYKHQVISSALVGAIAGSG